MRISRSRLRSRRAGDALPAIHAARIRRADGVHAAVLAAPHRAARAWRPAAQQRVLRRRGRVLWVFRRQVRFVVLQRAICVSFNHLPYLIILFWHSYNSSYYYTGRRRRRDGGCCGCFY